MAHLISLFEINNLHGAFNRCHIEVLPMLLGTLITCCPL